MADVVTLESGAELRSTGAGQDVVICVNGGGSAEVPGTWSASVEWLVERLAPQFPRLRFGEVRYRVKSWRRLDLCVEDGLAALGLLEPRRTLMLGFSMGGAVSVRVARESSVSSVVALAPWLPDRLDLTALEGKRLAIIHGGLDSPLPFIPGVRPTNSRRAFDRARALGIDATYTLIRGALHGVAVRSPSGTGTIPLPRARAWLEHVTGEIGRFQEAVA